MVRTARHSIDEDEMSLPRRLFGGFASGALALARKRPTDTAAALLAAGTTLTIVINAMFMQSGPHPAPIFANKPPPMAVPQPASPPAVAVLPRSRPQDVASELVKPRSDAVIAEIQRELARRGFYNGVPDGFYGPNTDSAIRDFEVAAG